MVIPLVESPPAPPPPPTSAAIAGALELIVASAANPVELNALGTAVPDWRLARTNVAGTDESTLYRLDASTDAVNAPYVVASATAGLRWVAIAGRYMNQDLSGARTAAFTGTAGSNTIATLGTDARVLSSYLDINGAVATFRGVRVLTGGLQRWLYGGTNGPESGGNLGTSFSMNAYDDAGAFIDTPFFIARPSAASPRVNINSDTQINTALAIGTAFTELVTQSPLRVERTLTDTQCGGIMSRINYTPAAGNSNQSRAIGATWTVDATAGPLIANSTAPNAGIRSASTVSAGNVTAFAGFTALPRNTGAGTVGDLYGYHVQTAVNSGGGIVTNFTGLRIETPNAGVNRYGIDVGTISGGTLNFAIRTGSGGIRFRDTTTAVSSITGAQVVGDGVTAATNVGIGGGNVNAGGNVTCNSLTVVGGVNSIGATQVYYGGTGGTPTGSPALTFSSPAFFVGNATTQGFCGTGGPVSGNGGFFFQSNSVNRWTIYRTGTESGADTGGNLVFSANTDAGVGIDNPLTLVRAAGGKITLARPTGVTNTTSAANSTNGALVIGDAVTAATNVAIGGGNINAGGTLTVAGSSSIAALVSSGSLAGDYLCKVNNASATGLGFRVQAGADANIALAVRNAASAISFNVLGSGATNVNNGTVATSPVIGALVVGDGVTGGTNVAIGGGSIYAGANITLIGALFAGGNVGIRNVAYVWPAANAAGALTNDGAGNLSWTAAGAAAVAAFYAGIASATHITIAGAVAATANRMHYVVGGGNFDITLPVAPAAGTVVGITVAQRSASPGAYRIDAGAGVIVAARTRYLTLLFSNVVLLWYDGAAWAPLVLNLDTPWVDAGAIVVSADTTNPAKGTTTQDKHYWRRVGPNLLGSIRYIQTAAGAPGNGAYRVAVPTGVIDVTNFVSSSEPGDNVVGTACLYATVAATGTNSTFSTTTFGVRTVGGVGYLGLRLLEVDSASTSRTFALWSSTDGRLDNTGVRLSADYSVPMKDW